MNTRLYSSYTISLGKKSIRFRFNKDSNDDYNASVWNCPLLLKVGMDGAVSRKVIPSIIEAIRNSYGIDFTKYVDVGNKTTDDAKSELLSKLDANVKASDSDGTRSMRRKLVKFNNRNKTYNEFRIRLYHYNASHSFCKILSAFLILTGQVTLDKSKTKFVFRIPKTKAYLRSVSNCRSYDKWEPFNQLIFERIYVVNLNSKRKKKLRDLDFFNACAKIPDFLSRKKIKYSGMYNNRILENVYKLSKLLTYEDTYKILTPLYEFTQFCESHTVTNKKESIKKVVTKLLDLVKRGSKNFDDSFLKCLTRLLLNSDNRKFFQRCLMDGINERYIDKKKHLELMDTLTSVVVRSK